MKARFKTMRIAMIGNLANVAFDWASRLNAVSFPVDLFLSEGEFAKLQARQGNFLITSLVDQDIRAACRTRLRSR
jgi:hypothetical protein